MAKTNAPSTKASAVTLIVCLILLVGLLDYLTGVRVSLVLFYLIPITLSVIWMGWKAGFLTAVVCSVVRVAGDLANGGYTHPWTASWNRLIDLFMYLVVVSILHALASLLREIEERVRQRTAALQRVIAERTQLQTELLELSQRERGAIGHDLHDGLGQYLTATSIAADLLARKLAADGHKSASHARNVAEMIQTSINTTRDIARGLLLAAVKPDQFLPELERLVAEVGQKHPIRCQLVHQGVANDRLTVSEASHLFYIAQEAVRNALRHANATAIEIGVIDNEDTVDLTVVDNGKGIPEANHRHDGMGLRIMDHRTELIGGQFSIEPRPGGGTLIRCRVILESEAASPAVEPS